MHINPYQLQTIDVEDETYFQVGDWHDSLAFEGGEDARVRMSVDTFTGKMILHCHILEHEDEGMMAVYDVRGDEGDVVSQAEALDLTCYRNSDRGYAYAAGGGATTRTYAPSYQPTPKPNYAPTASPSTNACADDDAWRKSNAPAKDCAWVAALPESRCAVKGDGVWAWRACRESCATCDYGCASGVGDDAGWRKNGAADKDCAWVSSFSYARSAVVGDDGRLAYEACPEAVKRCSYDGCDDDAAWHKKGDPAKDCAWAAAATSRCIAVGDDGAYGFEACKAACVSCAAAHGDACADDGAWHKVDAPSKDCAWVANSEARCAAKGADGSWAYDACPAACGICA